MAGASSAVLWLVFARLAGPSGASTLAAQQRQTLLDHSLRSESSAATLIRSLELGQLE